MIDLHTHILPDWDDGAADRAVSDRMIEMAREDGITKIGLAPHVFRLTKHSTDGRGLKTRVREFLKQTRSLEVTIYPGAEVYVHPDMIAHIKDFDLTVNKSSYVFIEFPSTQVPSGTTSLVYQMMLAGLIPIISHPERNAAFARSPDLLFELIHQGALAQVTAQSLTGGFGPVVQKAAESFLRHGLVHLMASDAHNADTRPPLLSAAVEMAAKVVGPARAEALVTTIPAAILDNDQIPNIVEPVCPKKKGKPLFFSLDPTKSPSGDRHPKPTPRPPVPSRPVAFFLPAMYGGGAERIVLALAGGIASRGIPVHLVLARREGPFLAEVPGSVQIVDLHARRDLLALRALVRYLRKEKPRVLFSGLHTNLIALWARRLARGSTRVIVCEHNTLSSRVQHYASDARMRWMPRLIRWFYPWADGIVAVSEGVADDLAREAKIPRDRIRVIYNPIVTPELWTKALTPLEHPWFGPGQPPVILAVGRLTAQKDFPALIKAFAQVQNDHSARLLILGEGEDRPALEALIDQSGLKETVELPGFVINPYPYMAQAHTFVLSSLWEGLPGALIEAMFCGTRLIATDCPSGPKEILQDGRYGLLVPVGDVEALGRAIASALRGELTPPPRESWRPFELDHVVEQYLDLFSEGEAVQT
jgi:tyrosine-protein phosphatase YwqE/glycosyltransferase involved in cell wall biosynthesis